MQDDIFGRNEATRTQKIKNYRKVMKHENERKSDNNNPISFK